MSEQRSHTVSNSAIPCSERMPPPREYVLMWEVPSLRWSVGDWMPEYQQWSNRDDREYAIHPHQVSHWMPLPEEPNAPLPDEPKTYDCDLCGKPGVCTKHIVHGAETMVCETCRERNE